MSGTHVVWYAGCTSQNDALTWFNHVLVIKEPPFDYNEPTACPQVSAKQWLLPP